jgi:hypothetical protein
VFIHLIYVVGNIFAWVIDFIRISTTSEVGLRARALALDKLNPPIFWFLSRLTCRLI